MSVTAGKVYRHYKGGRYLVTGVAETHHHNGDLDVVYAVLSTGKLCTRPLRKDSRVEDSWTDEVAWPDGKTRARFTDEEDIPLRELDALVKFWNQTNV
jgi:hypothetical protein